MMRALFIAWALFVIVWMVIVLAGVIQNAGAAQRALGRVQP